MTILQGPPWQSVHFGVKILGRKKYSGLFNQWIPHFQKSTFHLQKQNFPDFDILEKKSADFSCFLTFFQKNFLPSGI